MMKTMKLVKVAFEGAEYKGVESKHPEFAGCIFCDFIKGCLSTRGIVRRMCVQMMGSSGYLKKKGCLK